MLLSIPQRTDSVAQFLTVLILFIAVLLVTVLTTRWIAGYQKQQGLNGNIEIIETQRISNSKYIQIVRIGEKYVAIAVGKDTVTMLTEIPKEQLTFRENPNGMTGGFGELFEKIKKINSGENQEPKEK